MSVIVASLLLVAACSDKGNGTKKGEVVSAIEAVGENNAAYNKEIADLERKSAREEQENITSLKFDKEIHDFGEIATGSENKCQFRVTNTGTKPLTIYNVSASCGCTTPKKPEGSIAPGKSDIIEVSFKPNGPGPSEKTVTVQANTEPRISVLKITATVK